jgi:hypothetical protein
VRLGCAANYVVSLHSTRLIDQADQPSRKVPTRCPAIGDDDQASTSSASQRRLIVSADQSIDERVRTRNLVQRRPEVVAIDSRAADR